MDFDNVFTQLRQLQPEAAERFARHPTEWIKWLVDGLEMPGQQGLEAKRRLLVRRCYLNPNWYQSYRHSFLRAGFEIVDCPPVTSQGKTSTDIHMVLDIIELLQHETRYDEFIVFSADADFTPVLRKLRRHDRRTTVLAIGFPSAAYQASADLLIDERKFIQEALGLGGDSDSSETGDRDTNELAYPPENVIPENAPVSEKLESRPASFTTKSVDTPPSRPATEEELSQIRDEICSMVEQSPVPVSAARLASRIRQQYPHFTQDWNGLGTFKQFYFSLELPRLAWASGSGGRVYDPLRHQTELESVVPDLPPNWNGDVATFAVAREIAQLTGAPLLAPVEIRAVLEVLANDLAKSRFEFAMTVRRVSEEFQQRRGSAIDTRDVTFLIRGMQLNGHVFGEGSDDIRTLARRMVNQLLFLCQREQMVLNEAATTRVANWIAGDLLET